MFQLGNWWLDVAGRYTALCPHLSRPSVRTSPERGGEQHSNRILTKTQDICPTKSTQVCPEDFTFFYAEAAGAKLYRSDAVIEDKRINDVETIQVSVDVENLYEEFSVVEELLEINVMSAKVSSAVVKEFAEARVVNVKPYTTFDTTDQAEKVDEETLQACEPHLSDIVRCTSDPDLIKVVCIEEYEEDQA